MRWLQAIAAVVVVAAAGHEAGAVRLAYAAPTAAHRCPTRTRFAGEVAARLGFSPWSGSGARLSVRIEAKDAGFVGSVGAADRRRTFAADSCRKVADLLVTATAIALDRVTPAAPGGGASGGGAAAVELDGIPSARATIETWSFAPRGKHVELGLAFVSYAGAGLTGDLPIGPGHLQATAARTSSDSSFGDSTLTHLHALYLVPVFHLNEGSRFEVPITAGGGLGYQTWSVDQSTGIDMSESKAMPLLAGGSAITFRAFPVSFMTQMTFSLVAPPVTGQRLGFNFAIRYVFGG